MKSAISAAIAALTLSATASVAGNITPAPVDPIPTAPARADVDWTGFYIGGQLGYLDIDGDLAGVGGDGFAGGLHIGYDYDFGRWVAGASVEYDWADINIAPANLPSVSVDGVLRLKVRAGFEIGRGLAYVTGGYSELNGSNGGSEDGGFYGLGYEHLITDKWSAGLEVVRHEFGGGDGTAVQLRGSYRF